MTPGQNLKLKTMVTVKITIHGPSIMLCRPLLLLFIIIPLLIQLLYYRLQYMFSDLYFLLRLLVITVMTSCYSKTWFKSWRVGPRHDLIRAHVFMNSWPLLCEWYISSTQDLCHWAEHHFLTRKHVSHCLHQRQKGPMSRLASSTCANMSDTCVSASSPRAFAIIINTSCHTRLQVRISSWSQLS